MQWFRLRPTFEIPLAESRQEAVRKIDDAYQQVNDRSLMKIFGDYGELYLPKAEHRIWSPNLSFSVDNHEDHACIHGRFAPRFEVWTFVWICYMAFGFTAFFGFILGFSQFMIGTLSWGIWIGCVAMLLWGGLIVVAHVGQQLSSDQMHALEERFDTFLSAAELHRLSRSQHGLQSLSELQPNFEQLPRSLD